MFLINYSAETNYGRIRKKAKATINIFFYLKQIQFTLMCCIPAIERVDIKKLLAYKVQLYGL